MAQNTSTFSFQYTESKPLGSAQVTIDAHAVDELFEHTLALQQQTANPLGFNKNQAPKNYTHTYYQEALVIHLKEFFLKYHVVSYLYQQLHNNKIMVVGEPRLIKISLQSHQDAEYLFECTTAPKITVRDWRYLPFKAPLRKKYQDIDKQATLFIAQELAAKETYTQQHIAPGDWVLFEVVLLNHKQKILIDDLRELLWIQMSAEETGEPFRSLFIGKAKGDSFVTDHLCLQEYFGSNIDVHYIFNITIKEILPIAYFCLDLFKDQFKLKSERKAHQKIVEVYSFRNDISLRRSMVEEALTLLAKTYPFDIPPSAILRQEKIILDDLQNNQDYVIYKLQRDFAHNIHLLAEKQIREQMIADYFAHQENLAINEADVYQYLNLTKRPRTKEFVYFMHPAMNANEEEIPIQHEVLRHFCRKEKAVNHLLYHWGKP